MTLSIVMTQHVGKFEKKKNEEDENKKEVRDTSRPHDRGEAVMCRFVAIEFRDFSPRHTEPRSVVKKKNDDRS